MIKIKSTPQMAGITLMGDYEDLKALHRAISDYTEMYFSYQDNPYAEHCHECLLGLCYDLRHAFEGDRGYENIENNASHYGGMRGVIFELQDGEEESIDAVRKAYQKGNLYYTVEVLYPWAVYYMYTLQAITEDHIPDRCFDAESRDPRTCLRGYDKYSKERDASLIRYFVQLLWEAAAKEVHPKIIETVRNYSELYCRHDYYMEYPDMYLQYLCTYWVKTARDRKGRQILLPLLLLELSSIGEEDEYEVMEELHQAREDFQRIDADIKEKKDSSMDKSFAGFTVTIKERTLSCIKLYDTQIDQALELFSPPLLSMYEYMENIDEYVEEKGPFHADSYDQYLDNLLGEIDWDRLEW